MPKSGTKPVKPRNCKKQARFKKKKPAVAVAQPAAEIEIDWIIKDQTIQIEPWAHPTLPDPVLAEPCAPVNVSVPEEEPVIDVLQDVLRIERELNLTPAPAPPSGHSVVTAFLRSWAIMNNLDIPQTELTCDSLMMEIYKDIYRTAETFKQPTILQNVTCYTCGAKAPFLTLLGLEPARPITCLKCQGIKNISARVQSRVLEHIQAAEVK